MEVSQVEIENQINIIKNQKDIGKDVLKLKIAVEKYKDSIITTLNSVDQRKGTPELIKQIDSIDQGMSLDLVKTVFGISTINIKYDKVRGNLINTTYRVDRRQINGSHKH